MDLAKEILRQNVESVNCFFLIFNCVSSGIDKQRCTREGTVQSANRIQRNYVGIRSEGETTFYP